MKTKRRTYKKRRGNRRYSKNKRGGFLGNFFSSTPTPPVSAVSETSPTAPTPDNNVCNPSDLTVLESPTKMQTTYQKCCPKTWYGTKNNSSYCKMLDSRFQQMTQRNNKMMQNERSQTPQVNYQGYAPPTQTNLFTNRGGKHKLTKRVRRR
jgi:hypothetical protein